MRDVLAKPFTKEGMIGKLKKHLPTFLRNPPSDSVMDQMYSNGGAGQPPTPGPYANPNLNLPMSAASSGPIAKFETTPVQSPSTSTSWHSPAQLPHASPNMAQDQGYLTAGSGNPMSMTPGGTQRPQQYPGGMMPSMSGQQMGHMPDDGPPEKRQRLYGPGPQGPYA
jgi:osomolarity two-component system response regulator SKN7